MRPGRSPQPGFSLSEMVIATFLMSLMSMLILMTWDTFGRNALVVSRRAQLAQEAEVACTRIATDLAGFPPEDLDTASPAAPVKIDDHVLSALTSSGDMSLAIHFNGRTVTYRVVNDGVAPAVLLRSVSGSAVEEVVAQYVEAIRAVPHQPATQSDPATYAIHIMLRMNFLENRKTGLKLEREYLSFVVVPHS